MNIWYKTRSIEPTPPTWPSQPICGGVKRERRVNTLRMMLAGSLMTAVVGCALPPLESQQKPTFAQAAPERGAESSSSTTRSAAIDRRIVSNSMGQRIYPDAQGQNAATATNKRHTQHTVVYSNSTKPKPKVRTAPDTPSMVLLYDQVSTLIHPEGATGDLWAKLTEEMTLAAFENHPTIEAEKARLINSKLHLRRTVERSRRYLHHISSEIKKRNMPMDLVLVPAIESTFDPFAYSSGHASGLWQFVPGTSKWLGMKKTWWYDGRRDIVSSTETALDYLQDLNKRFDGDWLHTLAAYNSGATTVHRAIGKNKRANKPTDFWSLKLPKETRRYVPKILALSEVLSERGLHDLDLPVVPDSPYFTVVETHGQLDLAHAAKLADITVDELYRLNPGFNRWATDPDGPHRLLLPSSRALAFTTELAKIPKDERMQWARYKVKPGDNLSELASRFGTRVSVIKSTNSLDSNLIKPGQTLLMPTNTLSRHATTLSAQQITQAPSGSKKRVDHTVGSGESLSTIAHRYNVSTADVARWNSMKKTDLLRVGKTLTIWLPSGHSIPAGQGLMRKVYYTVRSGDSLSRIASRFRTNAKAITEWNSLQNQRYIKPGQQLTLYVDVTR